MGRKEMIKIGLIKERDDVSESHFTKCIGGKRGQYYGTKDVSAMQAAILDTMYDIGRDIALTPKNMVNYRTRLAYAYDAGPLIMSRKPRRGDEKCGQDMFSGIIVNRSVVSVRASWNQHYPKFSIEKTDIIRCEEKVDRTTGKQEWLDEQWLVLKEKHTLDKLHEGDELSEEQLAANSLHDYFNQDGYGNGHYPYEFRNTCWDVTSNYHGECAWEEEEERCSFHDGIRYELVLGWMADDEWNYFDELEDQPAHIDSITDDDKVLAHIKYIIPKMKTEARPWLESLYTTSEYKLEDETQPDKYSNREYYTVHHGKRGHYTLTWWHSIDQQTKQQKQKRENKNREGTELNGWKFTCDYNHNSGQWEPIVPLYKWVLGTGYNGRVSFRTERQADNALSMLVKQEGYINSSMNAKCENVDIQLTLKGDPLLHTPSEALELAWINKRPKYIQGV